ncbi:GIY-YIG nuclease family protein [Cryobacterium sp. Hh38]|uniref:GIY-YIG nuclease family protein n=1 Tax=Cryobacterium sp. Hh38 TaxID=1259156 RepID=UPI00106D422C|nr:GIY-YIG nuclease family protein [Cryobacterium sp. Hh38]TFD55740.1 GIY-YIG nuclease family protein [Cryobacterium sp. Hh38]
MTAAENGKNNSRLPVSESNGTDMQWLIDSDVDGLLDVAEKPKKITANDRLERAFLEIVEFQRTHDRVPSSTTREIAERKLGARLDGILADEAKTTALKRLDEFGLLDVAETPTSIDDLLNSDDFDLLGDDESGLLDTSGLPARARRIAPDDVATRIKSEDFAQYEHLFVQKHAELRDGASKLVRFALAGGQQAIQEGKFFVLSGIMLFVAEITDPEAAPGVRTRYKPRTRTIFENGTESRLFRRSLAGQLLEQDGYAVVSAGLVEIFPDDEATGYIYVLRSLSDDPQISNRKNLYKIGFTRGSVMKRIANAENEPTYLMAPVEIVSTYQTYNLKVSALEDLLHRVFAKVRLDINQIDGKGRRYDPSEWFVAPVNVIDQAINLIMSGDIVDYVYDAETQRLLERD